MIYCNGSYMTVASLKIVPPPPDPPLSSFTCGHDMQARLASESQLSSLCFSGTGVIGMHLQRSNDEHFGPQHSLHSLGTGHSATTTCQAV